MVGLQDRLASSRLRSRGFTGYGFSSRSTFVALLFKQEGLEEPRGASDLGRRVPERVGLLAELRDQKFWPESNKKSAVLALLPSSGTLGGRAEDKGVGVRVRASWRAELRPSGRVY